MQDKVVTYQEFQTIVCHLCLKLIKDVPGQDGDRAEFLMTLIYDCYAHVTCIISKCSRDKLRPNCDCDPDDEPHLLLNYDEHGYTVVDVNFREGWEGHLEIGESDNNCDCPECTYCNCDKCTEEKLRYPRTL